MPTSSLAFVAACFVAGPLANLALALVASVVVHFYSLATAANPSPTLPLPIVGLLW